MTESQRSRRRLANAIWKANPLVRSLAGIAPWWVVLETTGRRSGTPRRVPLARGPADGSALWLISVHGDRASFALNIAAEPRVRIKLRRTWLEGTAENAPMDEAVLRRFNRYARMGPRTLGIEPGLVRVELERVPG